MNRRSIALAVGIVAAIGVPTALSGPASADTSTKLVTLDGTIKVTDLRSGQACTWDGADVHSETDVVPELRGEHDGDVWERTCGTLVVRFDPRLRQLPSRKTVEAKPEMTVTDGASGANMTSKPYELSLPANGQGHDDDHAWGKVATFACDVDLTWTATKSLGDRAT